MQVGITLWGDSGDHSVQRPILAIYIVWDAGRKKLNEVQCIPSCLPIRKPLANGCWSYGIHIAIRNCTHVSILPVISLFKHPVSYFQTSCGR